MAGARGGGPHPALRPAPWAAGGVAAVLWYLIFMRLPGRVAGESLATRSLIRRLAGTALGLAVCALLPAAAPAVAAPFTGNAAPTAPSAAPFHATASSAGRVSFSPYEALPATAYRGEMHDHTVASDGSGTAEQVLTAYRDLGCDWAAITDHDKVTTATVPGIVDVSGCERTIKPTDDGFGHMLLLGLDAVPASGTMRTNVDAAAFSTLAHAGWDLTWGKWTVNDALTSRVRAIEVYNGFRGGVWSEALWDACLSAGAAPFCTVGDDMHAVSAAGTVGAYVVVFAEERSEQSILAALAGGRYYCTLGPRLDIAAGTGSLTVTSPDVCDWQFIGKGGRVLATVPAGRAASYSYDGTESYVRCKAVRTSDGRPAWTNPVFFADWQATVTANGGTGTTADGVAHLSFQTTSDLAPVVAVRVRRHGEAWPAWQDYAPTLTYDLGTAEGQTTLDVQFRDGLGTVFTGPQTTVTVDTSAPAVTHLTSTTHPVQVRWYADDRPAFAWQAPDPGNVRGYSFSLDRTRESEPDATVDTTSPRAVFGHVADGEWFFHVRARDGAGNWGPVKTRLVRIATLGPTTAVDGPVRARSGSSASLSYTVIERLPVRVRVTLVVTRAARAVLTAPLGTVAAGTHTARFPCSLPAGTYKVLVRATDPAGNAQEHARSAVLTVY